MMKHTGVFLGLAALLALFCLASCINTDNTLGSALVPTSQDITIKTATLDLPIEETRATADLQSCVSNSITVGNIGTEFYSEGLMSVTSSVDSVVWGSNPVVKRVYLSFACDTTLVMQDDQRNIPQNLYVHRLNFELDSSDVNGTVERFKKPYYDPEPVSLGGVVYTGGEAWSIDLKQEIGEQLLRIPMATRDSAELFMKQFYGFCLRGDYPDDAQVFPDQEGRLTLFDLSSSYLILSWEYTDDEGNRKASQAYFALGKNYTINLYHTLQTSSDAREGITVQGLTGSKPYLKASAIKRLIKEWADSQQIPEQDLVIAKATVEFPFEYDGDRTQFKFSAPTLYPCRKTKTAKGYPYYAPISEINNTELENGAIDRSLLQYKSNISLYLQSLLRKADSDLTEADDLWFMPIYSFYNNTTGLTYHYADNFYYTKTRLNGTSEARHPVLRLTYSVLK